jgi:hypothetical protein
VAAPPSGTAPADVSPLLGSAAQKGDGTVGPDTLVAPATPISAQGAGAPEVDVRVDVSAGNDESARREQARSSTAEIVGDRAPGSNSAPSANDDSADGDDGGGIARGGAGRGSGDDDDRGGADDGGDDDGDD